MWTGRNSTGIDQRMLNKMLYILQVLVFSCSNTHYLAYERYPIVTWAVPGVLEWVILLNKHFQISLICKATMIIVLSAYVHVCRQIWGFSTCGKHWMVASTICLKLSTRSWRSELLMMWPQFVHTWCSPFTQSDFLEPQLNNSPGVFWRTTFPH